MKTITFFLGVLLVLLLSGSAHPAHAQWVRGYGLKAGLVSSDIRSPDVFENEGFGENRHRRTGVGTLAFVEWLGGTPVSVVTEAGYAQRGFYYEFEARDAQNNPIGTIKTFDRFDYLSTAVLAKLRHDRGAVAPYMVAGPHLNVLLGGEPDDEGSWADIFNPTVFGGTVGVGVEANTLLPVPLFIELRYSFDVTNSLPDVPRDAYNNAVDLLLGVRF